MNTSFISNSEDETREYGARMGRELNAGDVCAFYGGLGSGKTRMIQGICRGLGVNRQVTSPTFTIVNEYGGTVPVYHMDFYRIAGPEEALELGWEEYVFGRGICLIEWAERVEEILPASAMRVYMELMPDHPDGRTIVIRKT